LPKKLVDRIWMNGVLSEVDCIETRIVGEHLIIEMSRDELEVEDFAASAGWRRALEAFAEDFFKSTRISSRRLLSETSRRGAESCKGTTSTQRSLRYQTRSAWASSHGFTMATPLPAPGCAGAFARASPRACESSACSPTSSGDNSPCALFSASARALFQSAAEWLATATARLSGAAPMRRFAPPILALIVCW
jgi:hypothetical protein